MEIRKAQIADISAILEIIKDAVKYLQENEVNQWQNGYPNNNVLTQDIKEDSLYIVVDNHQIIGVISLSSQIDPSYQEIYDGDWLSDDKYLVIHRIAVRRNYYRRGVARLMFEFAEKLAKDLGIKSIRVDTHVDNNAMNGLITSLGYKRCGVIKLIGFNNALREAFEKII